MLVPVQVDALLRVDAQRVRVPAIHHPRVRFDMSYDLIIQAYDYTIFFAKLNGIYY